MELSPFAKCALLNVANRTSALSLGRGQRSLQQEGRVEVNQGGPMSLPAAPVLHTTLTTYSHEELKWLNLKRESSFSYNWGGAQEISSCIPSSHANTLSSYVFLLSTDFY